MRSLKPLLLGALWALGSPLLLALPALAAPISSAVPFLTLNLLVQPGTHKLFGAAKFRLNPSAAGASAKFRLHPGLKVTRITLNGRAVGYLRDGDRLEVMLPRAINLNAKWILAIDYAGRPLQTQQGLTQQDVGPGGALLKPDGHWFPEPQSAGPLIATLNVRVPAGWRASGPSARVTFDVRKQTSHLEFGKDSRPAFAAGPYNVAVLNGVTYYFPKGGTPPLGHAIGVPAGYSVAVSPGAQTVVELPAGFMAVSQGDWAAIAKSGSPSLQLPAAQAQGEVPDAGRTWLTSSLAAYNSDLALEREKGHAAYIASLHSRQEAYEAFLRRTPGSDLPLKASIAPGQPAWEPVVLDKGALVWSLVHDELGDAGFAALLAAHRTALTKGHDPVAAVLARAGRRLDFVNSWLVQAGLPRYRLEDATVQGTPGAYQVTGVLTQTGPNFQTPLELALITEGQVDHVTFQTFAPRVPFHFTSAGKPLRLVLDPAETRPLARQRRLWIGESLARPDLAIVYGTHGDAQETQANQETALALAEKLKARAGDVPVVADTDVTPTQRRGALALVGRPNTHLLLAAWEDQLPVRFIEGDKALWWQGRTFQGSSQGVVQAIPNPEAPENSVVVLSGLAPAALADGLRYVDRAQTYCLFEGTNVLAEGEAQGTFPDLDAVLY